MNHSYKPAGKFVISECKLAVNVLKILISIRVVVVNVQFTNSLALQVHVDVSQPLRSRVLQNLFVVHCTSKHQRFLRYSFISERKTDVTDTSRAC
jgi:hypothetical protein